MLTNYQSIPYRTDVDDVESLFHKLGLGAGEYLIDLGSGDGRVVDIAVKNGMQAVGIERDTKLLEKCVPQNNARFIGADMFETDLTPYSIIYIFLDATTSDRFLPIFKTLKNKTLITNNHYFYDLPNVTKHIVNRTHFYIYKL